MGNNSVTTEGDYTMSKLLPPPPLCPNCGDQMIRQFTGNDPAARVFYCQKCKKTMPRDGEAWHGRDILCGCYIELKKIRTLMEKASLNPSQQTQEKSPSPSIQEAESNSVQGYAMSALLPSAHFRAVGKRRPLLRKAVKRQSKVARSTGQTD